jgi:GntR family transcriptional regulator
LTDSGHLGLVVLNSDTGLPLYRQLAEELSSQIYSGKFAVGARIPAESELATTYAIGRPTVRQATDLLVRRGLLERRRGSGTYVLSPREQVDLFHLAGTNKAFEGAGLVLETSIVEPVVSVSKLGQDAGPLASRPGFVFARLGKLEGHPVLVEHMMLRQDIFTGFDKLKLEGASLSQLVERRYHRRPIGGQQTLRVIELSRKDARLLEVDTGTPALLVERRLDFEGAPGSIFVRICVMTSRVALSQTLAEPTVLSAMALTPEKTR